MLAKDYPHWLFNKCTLAFEQIENFWGSDWRRILPCYQDALKIMEIDRLPLDQRMVKAHDNLLYIVTAVTDLIPSENMELKIMAALWVNWSQYRAIEAIEKTKYDDAGRARQAAAAENPSPNQKLAEILAEKENRNRIPAPPTSA